MSKWWILFSMCLVTLMLGIDATALNVAIPVIANEFYTTLSEMEWVINVFFLTAAMVQIAGGYLGDSYGHKKVFLITLFLFIVSSVGAGFAPNQEWLIAFRALQGASIGIAYPQTMTLLNEAFLKEEQAYARSFIIATMGISLAAGAPFGGLLVHTIGWRWIFYINIPIGLVSYAIAQIACHKKTMPYQKIDYMNLSILIVGLFALTFALNQIPHWGFASPFIIVLLVAAGLSLYFLYHREKEGRNSVVDFALFKNRNFAINNFLRFVLQIALVSVLFFLPLYLQNIAETSALVSGWTMLALTIVMVIASPFVGKWVGKEGEKKANLVSMGSVFIGAFLLLFTTNVPNFYLLCAALLALGLGIAIGFVSTTNGALTAVKSSKVGAATGLFFTIAWLSAAVAVSFSGILIAYVGKDSIEHQLKEHRIALSHDQYDLVERVSKGVSPVSSLSHQPKLEEIASTAFVQGVRANGWMFLILCVIGSFFALKLRNRKPHPPVDVTAEGI